MAHRGYYLEGKRVPSVTTVLGAFKEAGGLMYWSWNLAHMPLQEATHLLEEVSRGNDVSLEIEEFVKRDREHWDYRAVRDTAAGVGGIAHKMVEQHIRQKPINLNLYDKNEVKKAKVAFGAFKRWTKGSKFELVEAEVSLMSPRHKFGGTLDSIFIEGKRSIGDWKTASGVYWEGLLQLAAYKELWNENFPDTPIDGECHLIRFDRDNGDFHHHSWPELDSAWKAFLLMRTLYELKKEISKRAK